jgi:hypothetical protein
LFLFEKSVGDAAAVFYYYFRSHPVLKHITSPATVVKVVIVASGLGVFPRIAAFTRQLTSAVGSGCSNRSNALALV